MMMGFVTTDSDPPPASAGQVTVEQLFREHYRSLVRLAAILVDDITMCEELVQDAFVAVLRPAGGWADPDRAPAYIRSAVLNRARSHLRKQGVRRRWLRTARPAGDEPAADGLALANEESRTMLEALRALPQRQCEVLTLRYYLDLPEAEIATTLGISTGSVKTHAHRGLSALAARFGKEHR